MTILKLKNSKLTSAFAFLVFLVVSVIVLQSYSLKPGDLSIANNAQENLFYQTWDGKIHEAKSVSSNQYFTPNGGSYMVFDGEKILKTEIKAFQDKKGYYITRFGSAEAAIKYYNNIRFGLTPGLAASKFLFFAERQTQGKISVYFANTAVDANSGNRPDYFFQVGEGNGLAPLRTYTLKQQIAGCDKCSELLTTAETEYDGLPKWRKKTSDSYVGSEKKLSRLLIAVINEFNAH